MNLHLATQKVFFLEQLRKYCLPSSEKIHKQYGSADGCCALCGQIEIMDHIFVKGVLSKFICGGIRTMLLVFKFSLTYFVQILESLHGKTRTFIRVLFVAQSCVWSFVCYYVRT
jgi:hypothetical protein